MLSAVGSYFQIYPLMIKLHDSVMASADVNASPVPEVNGGSSGEFVLKKLFAEFVVVGERKLQSVCSQPLVRSNCRSTL